MVLGCLNQVQKVFEKLSVALNSPCQAISVAIMYMFIKLALQTMNGFILEIQVFVKNLRSFFVLNVVIGNITIENKSMGSECKVPV